MSQKHSKLNILHDLLSVNYGHRNKVYLSNRATGEMSFRSCFYYYWTSKQNRSE